MPARLDARSKDRDHPVDILSEYIARTMPDVTLKVRIRSLSTSCSVFPLGVALLPQVTLAAGVTTYSRTETAGTRVCRVQHTTLPEAPLLQHRDGPSGQAAPPRDRSPVTAAGYTARR